MYGVEKYIEKCLMSCIEQKGVSLGTDYEIVCVNDGSPDKSADIARRIAAEYQGIRVIDQENQGLSGARNTGIDNAKGEYVWFVDSDDWIETDCLSSIIGTTNGVDIVCLNYTLVYDDVSKNRVVKYKKEGDMSGIDLYVSGRHTQAQFYVCNRNFLNRHCLRFYPGIYHEDSDFNYRILYLADRVRVLDTPVYCFYKRPNSITTTFKPKRLYDLIIVLDRMKAYLDNVVRNDEFRRAMYYYLCMSYNTIMSVGQNAEAKDKKAISKMISEREYIIFALSHSPSVKHRIEGILMSLSLRNYFTAYKLFMLLK